VVQASVQQPLGGRGWRPQLARVGAPLAIFAGVGLALGVVNAISTNVEFGWRHVRLDPREPYVWELTSWFGLLVGFAPILVADRWLARARTWAARLAVAAAATVGYSAAHVVTMVGLRVAIYAAAGARYDFGPLQQSVLYEYRKDVVTVAMCLIVLWLWRRATADQASVPQPQPQEPAFFAESRQGRVLIRAPDIDWVEAKGNYVALHAGGRSYLIREPLKAVDAKLRGSAFVRTHRSALVNARRVRGIHRADAGGLKVELANAEFAPLSDRRRAAVVKALSPG